MANFFHIASFIIRKLFLLDFERALFIASQIFPPSQPELSLRRMKNFLLTYFVWKFGVKLPVKPIVLQIESVRGCNFNCVMCRAGQFETRTMKFEEFKKIICQFPETCAVIMNFAGEPFLSKDLLRMIRYASVERKMLVTTFSNFSILPEPEKVIESGLYEIIASIDTFNREKFSVIREKGDLDVVVDNLKRLVQERRIRGKKIPVISISAVFSRETKEDAEDIIENAIKIGVDRVKFQRLFFSAPPYLHVPTKDDFAHLLYLKEKYKNKIDVRIYNFEWGGDSMPGFCYLASSMLTIDLFGNVFPCCTPYAIFEPHKSSLGIIHPSDQKLSEKVSDILRRRVEFISKMRYFTPDFCRSCPLFKREKWANQQIKN
jgi:MoaA/NifB/PqqE/SkfB family radical SAM enzyme